MLTPFTSRVRQKLLTAVIVLAGAGLFCTVVYSYERYYRGLREADLAGTWTRVDPGAGGGYYEFRRDGTIVLLDDEDGQPTTFKGKWYAGGDNIYVRFPPGVLEDRQLAIWHIVDVSKDQFRVRIWQHDKDLAVWRRVKAPIRRQQVDLSDIPTAEVEAEVDH